MDISDSLLSARRVLDDILEYRMIKDWMWEASLKKWFLRFSITIENAVNINSTTYWVIVTDVGYPDGDINVYPDAVNGINETYPHQKNNGLISKSDMWKSGNLCLENQKYDYTCLPPNDVFKLQWYVCRTVQWVKKANESKLLDVGDWFESPDFDVTQIRNVAFNEDEVSFMIWESCDISFGFVELARINDNSTYFVTKYSSLNKKIAYEPAWGEHINNSIAKDNKCIELGAWILLKDIPVVNIWQAPNTFEELVHSINIPNKEFVKILSSFFYKFRDGKRHLLLVGFPVCQRIGAEASVIIWKSLLLPVLSYDKHYANGYRKNEKGWLQRDFTEVLKNMMRMEWVRTDNWSERYILIRGRFKSNVTEKRYLFIGAGTLSSFICEQLVRNGVKYITIIDSDVFYAGNLARHTLTMHEVGKNKAVALANHLNSINVHARVKAVDDDFLPSNAKQYIKNIDLIIDCSADDEVLKTISLVSFQPKVLFFSISFGFKAEQLYISAIQANLFSYDSFKKVFKSIINKNMQKYDWNDMPWEGIGCWSPVFPATSSDVMLAASTAVNILSTYLCADEKTERNFIYEKLYNADGYFIGYEELKI